MSVITASDDQQVRLSFRTTDAEGVGSVDPALNVSVDHPELATLTPDAAVPGDYIVRRVPGGSDTATVIVTATHPIFATPGISSQVTIVFNPGAIIAVSVTSTLEALTPA